MKRRSVLCAGLASVAAASKSQTQKGSNVNQAPTKSVGIWVDQAGNSHCIAAGSLAERPSAKGLYGMAAPVSAKLPSGLRVEVSCERIATGQFHIGISHNDKLVSMGKYGGALDVRLFPEGHSSYVVSVKWEA